jgi:large subunit ribosomal protein L17
MRHRIKGRRLSRTSEHRKALFKNLAQALIKHEQVITTLHKAKDLRPIMEKLVTKAKKGGLANRRLVHAQIRDDAAVAKLFSVLAPRYEKRAGGYIRVLKAGHRDGDNAPMAVIEFVDRDETARGKDSGPTQAKAAGPAEGEAAKKGEKPAKAEAKAKPEKKRAKKAKAKENA